MQAAYISNDGTPQGTAADWARRMQTALARVLAVPVALLVALLAAAEIGVLLAAVIARYVFHNPLIWSDELASILFLWLAMLGSAVAFERGDHMRMTAVVSKLPPATRAFLDVLATAAAVGFGAMALFAMTRLVQVGRPRQVALALTVGLIVLMTSLQPWRRCCSPI